MLKIRLISVVVLILGFLTILFVVKTEPALFSRLGINLSQSESSSRFAFSTGLDLSGGTHLSFLADTSTLPKDEVDNSLEALRDVIERRVNLFGVSEPIIVVEEPSLVNNQTYQLRVDLPGVTDISEAVKLIGQTPFLEFRVEVPNASQLAQATGEEIPIDKLFAPTELTGRYLKRALLEFDPVSSQPVIGLEFDADGATLFEEITGDNIGKVVAIFLDGAPISAPIVNEAISGGRAQISGGFTAVEAKELVGRLNSGALPIPIELVSTEKVGPTLGNITAQKGIFAVGVGFLAIIIFFLVWYRLPGFIASISLLFYMGIVLSLFKIIPVTITSAGIAGFLISIGIAVDANVLIFERIKEKIREGLSIKEAIREGYNKAWVSVRDSNTSSFITAIILYWAGTSLIKGFALTFIIGVLSSLFVVVVITRTFLFSFSFSNSKIALFLFGSGVDFPKNK